MRSFSRYAMPSVTAGLVGLASLALMPASAAAANLEYARDYEIAFLEACGAKTATRVCQCAMEAIQDEMTYQAFTEAVARYGGDLSNVPWWNAIVSTALAKCHDAPTQVATRPPVPTTDAASEGCRDAGELTAEVQRAAHVSE